MLIGNSSPTTDDSGTGTKSERMFVRGRPPSGRRRFGETSETVELDNQGLLQLHKRANSKSRMRNWNNSER